MRSFGNKLNTESSEHICFGISRDVKGRGHRVNTATDFLVTQASKVRTLVKPLDRIGKDYQAP